MSTVVRSKSGKQLTLDQGILFDMPETVDLTEQKPKKASAAYSQELGLITDLKRRVAKLEREVNLERDARKQAWDRATEAMEAEHFLRRLAEFMARYQSDS